MLLLISCTGVACASDTDGFQSPSVEGMAYGRALLDDFRKDPQSQTPNINQLSNSPYSCQLEKADKEAQQDLEFRSDLFVFTSLSLPRPLLISIGKEVSAAGGVLVLRGLKEGDFKKTLFALKDVIEQTHVSFSIDPELFKAYSVRSVPTIVLANADQHDTVIGNVRVKFALEKMSTLGDLQDEARKRLQKMRRL